MKLIKGAGNLRPILGIKPFLASDPPAHAVIGKLLFHEPRLALQHVEG